MDVDETGMAIVWKCYPRAFSKIYEGKSCYVYEAEESFFVKGATGWDAELVSEHDVPVINEGYVPDLYSRLMEEVNKGNLLANSVILKMINIRN
jgi:hypothetical protein